ncbi:hypothetical protein PR202_gb09291 [Eleusine coracana subsp. coracana]|uniref:Uncharacterized protein n=1 Tax=Eleusine coracana subsp. coracana TaxID=191504 RepID=A0AAV5EGS5_ELECO|nr:hypothetical protein PR202_gb09291 [Eleusine coracana subsp. coracana]
MRGSPGTSWKEEEEAAVTAVEDAYHRTSCWGRFGLSALWRRLRLIGMPRRHYRTYVLSAGGLNYDLLNYSQNFDNGNVCEREPDFLSRFAAR